MDISTSDVGGYVTRARELLAEQLTVPPGYALTWSGQYEYMERAAARLRVVIPLTLFLMFLLLYLNFRNVAAPLTVMLSVPFALVGGFWAVHWLGFNISVAVAVGFIALAGVAVETGVLVLTFIEKAVAERRRQKREAISPGERHEAGSRGEARVAWPGGEVDEPRSHGKAEFVPLTAGEIDKAVHLGTSRRVRAVSMTAISTIVGLLPIMLASGAGSDVMQRIAAPMIGGMVTTLLLCLLVLPVVYGAVLQVRERVRVGG